GNWIGSCKLCCDHTRRFRESPNYSASFVVDGSLERRILSVAVNNVELRVKTEAVCLGPCFQGLTKVFMVPSSVVENSLHTLALPLGRDSIAGLLAPLGCYECICIVEAD